MNYQIRSYFLKFTLPVMAALLLSSGHARAQIALHDGSTNVYWVASSSETISVTATAGASVLVVLLEDRGNGATAPATLSWNGITLTNIIQEQHSMQTQRGEAIYYAYNPPVGTNNLTATVTGSTSTPTTIALTAYTLSGVNTSIPPLIGGTNTGSSGGEALIPFTINNVLSNSWAVVNLTTGGAGAIYTTIATTAITTNYVTAGNYNDTGNGNVQQAGYVGPLPAGTITFTTTDNAEYSDKDNYEAAVFTPAGESPPPVTVTSVVPSTTTPTTNQNVTVTANVSYSGSVTPSATATLNASGLNSADSSVAMAEQSYNSGTGLAVYTNTVTVSPSTPLGPTTLTVVASDTIGNKATNSVVVTVTQSPSTNVLLTTTVSQGVGDDWTMAIWQTNGMGTAVSPVSGSTYECLPDGIAIGNDLNETIIRSPAAGGLSTFPGDSLTMVTNTEIRLKTVGSILNFPGVGGNPGLILEGGMLNVGDPGGFTVEGVVQVANQSYLCPGSDDAGSVDPNRYINFNGQLTGSGNLVLFEGGTSNPMQISGNSNTFSGQWIVKCGYLQGAGINSLGTNSITVDPEYVLASPPFDPSITNAQAGPAVFEANYDLNSAGTLSLTNGGQMLLHQNCAFSAVTIAGTSLSAGTYSYSQLSSTYPANFPAGGSGSITVQGYNPKLQIETSPANQTASAGQTVQLTVAATGTPPIFYQWQAGATNGGGYTNLTDGGQISGSATATLTISSATPANTADYLVIISNSSGSITSSVATLVVTQAPPSIVTQPVSQALYTGQTAQFTASATGTPPLFYQWQAGATNSGIYTNLTDGGQISGSATTSLTINNLTLSNTADYIVVVANSLGSATSSVAKLTVQQAPPQFINVLQSPLLELVVQSSPFSFQLIELSSGTVLLQQTTNQFTIGGTYGVYYATNFIITPTTMDADLFFSGTSATGHITFNFIQLGILQTTLSSSNNTPSNIFQQFADQGEDIFGALEVPYNATLSDRGNTLQLIGGQSVPNIDQSSGARAPFYATTRHYGIYVESDAVGTMTFDQSGETGFSFPVPQLTYDILYGTNYAAIMAGFNSRTVPSYMPPTWAFDSVWWKDDDHDDLPPGVTNAQGNVLDTASKLALYQIRASSEWVDRPYGSSCGQGDGGWGNMDWDMSSGGFNNPPQMVSTLQGEGLNLMLWISDLCWCDLYDESLANGWLFYTNNSSTNNTTVNLTNTNAFFWFQTNLNNYVDIGIKGYKIDRGDQGEMPSGVNNQIDTLFQQLTMQGVSAPNPNDAFVFSRSASDTGRSYSALWNGDTGSTFAGLQYSIIAGLRAGVINFPMWGFDTGGYLSSPIPTEELFDRWLEFSAYSTMMEVLHGGGRTPWYNYSTNFSSPTNIVAIAAAQAGAHHDLMPYSRSLLYQATQNGMPVMRPIFFGYPTDTNESGDITNCEYLFGPNILVAPVITAGATNRSVYLPADNWLDYNTKSNIYTGPANIAAAAPIQTIPLYVNEGAIIPRGDIWQGNNSWTSNWAPSLRIEFYPSENSGSSFPYYTGSSVQTIACANQNHTLSIQFGSLGYAGNLQVYLESLGSVAGTVVSNGVNLASGTGYTYNPATHLLQVPFNGPTTLVVSNAGSLFSPLEAWRVANFGNPSAPAVSGDGANPSGDGIPNFLKYAFGLNPLAVSTNGLPFESIVNDSGTNYLALTFQQATNTTDCTFSVLVTTNLVPTSQWQTGATFSGQNIVSNTAYTTEIRRVLTNNVYVITVRDDVPMNAAPHRFMTVNVAIP